MAILAGGLLVIPEEPAIETPPTVAYREDVGTITASWIDPDGGEWPLSMTSEEIGWFTMDGPAGWGSTPVELVVDPLPRGGEQVRFIRSKPRRIQWPVYVFGDDHLQFNQRYRQIMRAFTMTTQRKSPGWLRVQRPDGRYRQIACYYEQGFEGEAGQNHLWSKPVVQLYCPDGYWANDRSVRAFREFIGNGVDPVTPPSFYGPFMNVASSRVVSAVPGETSGATIVNGGDVEAWPSWKITGPMTKISAENLTAGAKFALTYTLTAGQTITITTNRPSVRGPGELNLSKYVDWFNPAGGSELWPLVDGANEIQFQVDGAATGTTVEMLFTPRHETA